MSRAMFAKRESSPASIAKAPSGGLRIGEPNDAFEQEADRVADEIMSGGKLRSWSIANVGVNPPLRRKCSCGGSGGECEECKKQEGQMLRRKSVGHSEPDFAPPIVHEVLKSAGQPLDPTTRDFFEARFGCDLSHVRIHSDSQAAESAMAVNARAYTLGQNLVFAAGQYETGTRRGLGLIAHELAHVIQQNGSHGASSALAPETGIGTKQNKNVPQENHRQSSLLTHSGNSNLQRKSAEVEEEDERHRTPVILKDAGGVLQRQTQNIPPPPPAYPHFTEIYLGEVADEITSLQLTCNDRRERAFWIYWDTNTKKATPGETLIGDPPPKDCSGATVQLPPMPRNRGNILVAGFFHNHPPQWPNCRQITVGPSTVDKNTASRLKLPGLVEDFTRPGPNTNCKSNPRGIFFYGPPRRTD